MVPRGSLRWNLPFWWPYLLRHCEGEIFKLQLGNRDILIQHTWIDLEKLVPNFFPNMPLKFTFLEIGPNLHIAHSGCDIAAALGPRPSGSAGRVAANRAQNFTSTWETNQLFSACESRNVFCIFKSISHSLDGGPGPTWPLLCEFSPEDRGWPRLFSKALKLSLDHVGRDGRIYYLHGCHVSVWICHLKSWQARYLGVGFSSNSYCVNISLFVLVLLNTWAEQQSDAMVSPVGGVVSLSKYFWPNKIICIVARGVKYYHKYYHRVVPCSIPSLESTHDIRWSPGMELKWD